MRFHRVLSLCLLMAGCGNTSQPPAVGYDGPLPSGAMQAELKSLRGMKFLDTTGKLGGGQWLVENGFDITPYETESGDTVKGPHASLARVDLGGDTHTTSIVRNVPMTTDEEARAFLTLVQRGQGDAGKQGP